MNSHIPTYQLASVTGEGPDLPGVFFLDRKIEAQRVPLHVPYRRNFYAVGICLQGRAELKANLDTYTITQHCLVAKPPYTINQWTHISDDFETLTLFFTKDFITAGNSVNPDRFLFFDMGAKHVIQLSPQEAESVATYLRLVQQKVLSPHAFSDEIIKNLINSLLYEMASLYNQQHSIASSLQTRSQLLAAKFKTLVNTHYKSERSLGFYAGNLFITPKHLTETVKEVTGKTAGDWIAEAVMLEARVLLQNPSVNIAEVADILHFPDPSTFARFFKKGTGLSPSVFKQAM